MQKNWQDQNIMPQPTTGKPSTFFPKKRDSFFSLTNHPAHPMSMKIKLPSHEDYQFTPPNISRHDLTNLIVFPPPDERTGFIDPHATIFSCSIWWGRIRKMGRSTARRRASKTIPSWTSSWTRLRIAFYFSCNGLPCWKNAQRDEPIITFIELYNNTPQVKPFVLRHCTEHQTEVLHFQ